MKPLLNPNIPKMPCHLEGDLDGDNKDETLILVKHTSTNKKGIAILHGNGKNSLIGAGKRIGNSGDSFGWMDIWRLQKKPKSLSNVPIQQGLYVAKSESASGFIYWKNDAFVWHQQGD